MRRFRTTGFTLIELLAVVIIITLLVAITLPVYMRMGRSQKQSACMGNMRELGIALTLYWQDNHYTYPRAPHPEYLQSQGTDPTTLPYSRNPAQGPWEVTAVNSGQSQLTTSGTYTGGATAKYRVEVDGTNPDTFKWSDDDGVTWDSTLVAITGKPQVLNDGVSVTFELKGGHAVGDAWTFLVGPMLPGWTVWQPTASAKLTVAATAGDSSLTVDDAAGLLLNERASLIDPQTSVSEVVVVSGTGGTTVSLATPLVNGYPIGAVLDSGYELIIDTDPANTPTKNFGLATMYYLFFNDQKDYLRSRRHLHCPAFLKTNNIDRSANLTALRDSIDPNVAASAPFREFDPLWAGYNNYDFTYNYDQYHNAILAYDAAVGLGDLNGARQLKNRYPPADTVVSWCYGHRDAPVMDYPDPATPAFTVPTTIDPDDLNVLIRDTEKTMRGRRDVVLWVDGTVQLMHPTLVRGREAGGNWSYYWVPPFLYTLGDWRS
ncbi:MAG: type II secretion system protein [Armatimonadota bacterium]